MKLSNLSISSRLIMGFIIILSFVALIGLKSYMEANRIWQYTEDLYNHPFQVNKASRDVKIGILLIEKSVHEIASDPEMKEGRLNQLIREIDDYEENVYQSFDVVYQKYLGPKINIDSSYNAFKGWKLLRDEVIQLSLDGDKTKAYTKFKKDNGGFRERMFKHIQVLVDFSSARADEFYLQEREEMKSILTQLWIVMVIIFILSGFIALRLIMSIRRPLNALTRVTDQYRQGNYDARSDYHDSNEIGLLATTFNSMASTVQKELFIKEESARISAQMLQENELHPFCKSLINSLLTATQGQVAAIYFLNEEKTLFEHYESIGLSTERIKSFSALTYEGEFGAVLSEKKIRRITQIPDDTHFSFQTVTGNFKPREIMTIPILDGETVVSVISLASLHQFSDTAIHLIEEIWLGLIARINGVMAFNKTRVYLEKLNIQNENLAQQSVELTMQSEELKEYNIELELQKNQLSEANQLKNAFLSNMSHELRTPLNSVIALSGVLNRRLKNQISADESGYLGIIEKNGKQLLSLINDILDLSRIESGREEIIYSELSLSALVQTIVESLEPIARGKNIAIINEVSEGLTPIVTDNAKCYHILQNIINNAVKFTERGKVQISADQVGDSIHISVKDTGIGISEDDLPVIFDEFRQADNKASRRFGGTGLGLAIAKKYAHLLNGKIDVKSRIGEGSTFTLTLPMRPAGNFELETDLNNRSIIGNPIFDKGNGSSKTLLLVEDSEPAIIQITDILSEEGYSLSIARSGKEALEILKTIIPDAIILDLMMPEVDGFEVLKNIRSLEETKQIPVLILSAKHISKEELSFLKHNHIYQLIRKGDINRLEILSHIQNMVNPRLARISLKEEKTQIVQKNDLKKKLLVIEDNRDNLEVVKAMLQGRYQFDEAINGIDGIEKARKINPDLILLDISLPGMDGYAVLKELKNDKNLKNVPVIALTARAMKGDREGMLNYGFDDYISKPIADDLFEKTISKWIYDK